ncbi:MAG: hypothetical protein HC831_10430 [Chloroflexia bacterium]|nr:hypothetical protein [Chloroflexia bacterium]
MKGFFFHDILNMVNGLRGLSMFLEETSAIDEMKEYISTLSNITERLIEIISAQHDLINAEKES